MYHYIWEYKGVNREADEWITRDKFWKKIYSYLKTVISNSLLPIWGLTNHVTLAWSGSNLFHTERI